MEKISKNQIARKIEYNEPNSIQIVQNHENKSQAVMYLSSNIFTMGYEFDYSFETLAEIKNAVKEDVSVFVFTDKELQEAWINSYLQGGISEDRFDRRAEFNSFNKINELFCINNFLLEEILGTSYHQDHIPEWKKGIIDWYRNQLI